MADQIEEIKQKTDIVAVVQERVKLARSGRNFKAVCPFHSERTPSFMVSPELQIFKCFGCGKGGDAFAFLREYEGMDFPEALRYLASRAGIELQRFQADKQYERKEKLREITHLASEYFHFLLTEHKSGERALRYLMERNISKRAISNFHLGFAPNSWDALISYLVGKKKYMVQELEAVGLVIQKGGKAYDRFRNRVIFPLRDVRGNVVGFAGRVMPGEDESKAKYINSPETELYHKSYHLYGLFENRRAIKREDQVVLVEGELDMISSWQVGVKQVVAIKGTSLTTEQVALIRKYTRRIILALDADQAGDMATKRSIALADEASLFVSVALIHGGKDPDDIARSDPNAWKKIVSRAVSVYDYYLKSLTKRYDLSTGLGKKQASEEFTPVLSQISNSVEQAHYIRAFSKLVQVSEESVVDELRRFERTATFQVKTVGGENGAGEVAEKSRGEVLESYLLSLLLQGGKQVVRVVKSDIVQEITSPGVRRILKRFFSESKHSYVAGEFIGALPTELQSIAQQAYMHDLGLSQVGEFDEEVKRVSDELRIMRRKVMMNDIGAQIQKLEQKTTLDQHEETLLADLQQQFNDLSCKLT